MTGRVDAQDHLGRLADLAGVAVGDGRVAGKPALHVEVVGHYQSMAELGFLASTMSFGMSSSTGPGRPVVAMWKASRTARGMSCGRGDQLVVLGDRPGDADRVALLEGVGADGGDGHLTRDDDHRDRVHVGVAQRGDDVGGRRARGDHGHARPTRHVGVALGHVAGALLVAHEDVADRAVEERVVHGQDAPARQAEDRVDALHLEGLDECLRTVELHALRFPSLAKRRRPPGWEVVERTRGCGSRCARGVPEWSETGHGRECATQCGLRQEGSGADHHFRNQNVVQRRECE